MSVKRAFAIVLASGLALSVGGGGIGYALARFAPFYYRGVFPGGDSPGFDPVQVGVGLGITQGLIAGLTVGSVVVLAVTLTGFGRPLKGQIRADDEVGQPRTKGCLCGVLAALVGLMTLLLPVGLLIGALGGENGCKTRRFSDEKGIIDPVLASDPSLSSLKIEMYTGNGTALLYGEVATKADMERLKSRIKTLMGESRTTDIMNGVSVRDH